MDPEKIAAVAKWPTTKTVLALCGFLGLTGYSRKFIKDYGAIAAPLTKLTKEALVLGDNTNHALDALKAALTSVLLLQYRISPRNWWWTAMPLARDSVQSPSE